MMKLIGASELRTWGSLGLKYNYEIHHDDEANGASESRTGGEYEWQEWDRLWWWA